MQPKTAEKNQIKLGSSPIGDKKDSAQPSTAEQWDQVAFRLIQQELAPKGYSEIKRGPYRGSVQANIPFLRKQSVLNCQKLAAQLVRTFRGKAQNSFQNELKKTMALSEESWTKYKATPFWKFKEKKRWFRLAIAQSACAEAYQDAMGILLQQDIK